MRVIVLGAGVIGVTSAYYLSRAGHEVTVIDRQPGPALETSFANAGEVSPGYASPWAAPGIPQKAVRWLLMKHAPLILRPKPDAAMLRWLAMMLRNCTEARYALNKSRMVGLAEFSRDELKRLRGTLGIAYDERAQGTLQLFRTEKQLAGAAKDMAVLDDFGVDYELLDRAGCVAAEPGLAATSDKFVGGLCLPGDETGDCRMFTRALAERAAAEGVEFRYDTVIEALEHDGRRVSGVRTSAGVVRGDACLVALASYSPLLLKPFGLTLPVYPVKGYSITVPVADPDRAPVSTLLDESYKIAITRLGNRVRVGGMAEISGFDRSLPARRQATLLHSLTDLFPGGAKVDGETNFWSGLRPMTPDGPPVIGKTPVDNLFLNTGHGTLGWTMACGSGHLIASLIGGTAPAVDPGGLGIDRY
ncbi:MULTISPECIES: D-amino acid dehydrogenase [unclassified Sphingomonas]|uniref:D-amino acid dehydrogenase n=1 Tax=unclassified Sphingomonas TaxID=196159 RepID=UPI000929F64F|nr:MULTISPECIES: D-amino acid dehydrogenase [unclassified Sphingomonas]MBN8847877.1 D-amino acid dehydrogenase [Sphingomonas sp.]OJV33449.1 MAG: D-amino acid dehydrogenase small subunit [Sphingomonas sp. 67-36]